MNFRHYPAPFPKCLRDLGFEDTSYGNDAAGLAAKYLPDRTVFVWCSERSRPKREYPGERFGILVGPPGRDVSVNDAVEVIVAESESHLKKAIKAVLGGDYSFDEVAGRRSGKKPLFLGDPCFREM
jgi:hypothetical protein